MKSTDTPRLSAIQRFSRFLHLEIPEVWVRFLLAIVGLILAALGALANTEDAKKRMLYMHIAVTIGLLGFLGTAKSIVDYIQMVVGGRQFPHPVAVEEKAAMAGVLLVFVALCVRSFISARRARVSAAR